MFWWLMLPLTLQLAIATTFQYGAFVLSLLIMQILHQRQLVVQSTNLM